MRLTIVIFIYGLLGSLIASAQVPASTGDTLQNGKKIFEILDGRVIQFLQQDSTHNFNIAVGNVCIKQEKTLFYADSVVMNNFDKSMEAFGNIHINDADSVHTYAQYLKYNGITKKAILRKSFHPKYISHADGRPILPESILWRKKEAFSDGVSSLERSLFQILQERIAKEITTTKKKNSKILQKNCLPQ